MKRYDSYKDSGVELIGEIPSHWMKSKFKYLTAKDVQYGINLSSDNYLEDGIRFIRTTDISDNGDLSNEGVYVNEEIIPLFQITEYLDFLISRSGTLGRTYLHLSNDKMTYGGYLVRFNFSKVELSKFIKFYCLSTSFWDWIDLNTIVSTIGNVNGQKYSNLELPIPPLSEQEQIVSYLDRKTALIDTLVEKTQRKIELLKEKRTALINEVVTKGLNPDVEMKDSGVEWIGEIPRHWEVKKVFHFGEVTLGKMLTSEDKGGYFLKPYLRSQNIQSENVDVSDVKEMWFSEFELEKLRIRKGDLLLNEGGDVGRTCIWKDELEECYFQNSVNRIRFFEDSQEYYLYLSVLYHSVGYYDSIVNRVSIPHLTKEKLESVRVIRPPLFEQKEIVSYLNEQTQLIDQKISIEERRIELLKEYRQSLISEVVTGKRKVTPDE